MAITTFGAIDVGSYEIALKIFEISPRIGLREIDHIRHRIELGTDTYSTGKIGYERVEELCAVLRDFSAIMKSYKVDAYKAYGTSAIREADNTAIVLDQIRIRTGIQVEVLSNSEQRFLDYKSIASKGEGFQRIIEKGTAIVDIGGGSIQVSLFDNDSLVTTQNMRLGVLRLREKLQELQSNTAHYEELVEEVISNQLVLFKKMYVKERSINNLIIVDDYVSDILQNPVICKETPGYIEHDSFMRLAEMIESRNASYISEKMRIPEERASLLFHSMILIKRMMEILEADLIWAPGVNLCDGIAYEYAEKNKLITIDHDFEKDIIVCAANISKRYMGSKRRSDILGNISLTIFDSIKKVHGLGKRERLLLHIATLLHDCGKYISLSNVGECSYSIIMATEIIGLSHQEREIIANVVKYNHLDFEYYPELSQKSNISRETYLIIAKLTAILRLANGLDRSHKQKFRDISAVFHDPQLVISVVTSADITLEKGLLTAKADFFEEIFSVKPVIRQKRKS